MDINMTKMNFDIHLFYIKILTNIYVKLKKMSEKLVKDILNIYVNIETKLGKVEIYYVRVK